MRGYLAGLMSLVLCAACAACSPSRNGCKGTYPVAQGASQPCCLEWGVDACGANLTCAALDGRVQPTCYPEYSRLSGQTCTGDTQCTSAGCSAGGLCKAVPGTVCDLTTGCGPGVAGTQRYHCAADPGTAGQYLCQPCPVGSTDPDCTTATPAADAGVQADAAACTPPLHKADILFMIDNSPSMAPLQNMLIDYFPNFIEPLKGLPTPPDLHIGIVSSDMGAGHFTNVPGCRVGGDQGMLQNQPRNPTKCGAGAGQGQLKASSDRFLSYASDPAGGTPTVNFNGDIGDAFACYADLGDQGCGFEYQLGSVQAALDGCGTNAGCTQPVNEGFLRADAYLAIIVLSNEDDASAPAITNLWDPSQTSITSVLGPLTSYRQFEFGNVCDGQPPGRTAGPRSNCVPGSWDADPTHQEIMPEVFAAALKGLKPQDPRLVFLSLITGPPDPVAVALDPKNGYPVLQPSCNGGAGTATWSAVPSTHFYKLATLFDADRAAFISLCQPDLETGMSQIAQQLAEVLSSSCP